MICRSGLFIGGFSTFPLRRKNRLALSVPALETKTSRSPTGSREQGYLLEILKLRGDTSLQEFAS
jgi:hypothetical protein